MPYPAYKVLRLTFVSSWLVSLCEPFLACTREVHYELTVVQPPCVDSLGEVYSDAGFRHLLTFFFQHSWVTINSTYLRYCKSLSA